MPMRTQIRLNRTSKVKFSIEGKETNSSAVSTNLYVCTKYEKVSRAPPTRVVGPLQMAAAAEGKSYWEGEWVCADCGYIYDVDDCGGLYFEQQV